ncbi:MAG: hypothetical protein KA444_04625 [Bacteroidia bacterium]|nr:hypothetical protein [Bacteroidia bacterium]
MELTIADIDLLDRFVENKLSSQETSLLKERMKGAEFAKAAHEYLKAIDLVNYVGRSELRNKLVSIETELKSKRDFENYKPSSPGKGFGGSGLIVSIVSIIALLVGYLIYDGTINLDRFKKILPESHKIDTIYHYNVIRDTVIVNGVDTSSEKTIKRIVGDTTYVRTRTNGNDGF